MTSRIGFHGRGVLSVVFAFAMACAHNRAADIVVRVSPSCVKAAASRARSSSFSRLDIEIAAAVTVRATCSGST